MVTCTIYSDAVFHSQRSGHGLDASVVIIDPSPISMLYKECSLIVSDWLIKKRPVYGSEEKAGLPIPERRSQSERGRKRKVTMRKRFKENS